MTWGVFGFILSLVFVAGILYIAVDWIRNGQPW